ncbi:hypothetical protein [Paracandidimonas soli]|uniref:Uncharacterized protein n=1 Tax=Paracandidimonas soli TaxID=1917182 RepID=A0A4R3V162_9BURK|nr:hypothetical protein [Paracandidimonas soli]TCU96004.1 hypothetical protein EV686_10762 [Paracandidimonas soli]
MNEIRLNLTAHIEESVAPERAAQVVKAVISGGLFFWNPVGEGRMPMRVDGGDLEMARLASVMDIIPPTVAKPIGAPVRGE